MEKKMKVMGFIGSPRKKGNTAWIVNKILEGAKEEGAETKVWAFNDLDIKPCQGCLGCHNGDGGCVICDDMQKLYEELKDVDALVLGSPVYMGQMSAQAKIFVDRLSATNHPRFYPQFKERAAIKMILVFDQGNPDSSLFQTYYDYMKKMFQMLEFDVKDVVVVNGMRNGPAHERKDLHTSMKGIGLSLVSEKILR
ncbi:flavodoxin family protein [Clostridium frigoriphilum]|uniref:Flavodoxin family protein n=2 Tax=Clostridiaceae TaxID=31979 RepID=A0ABU7UR27_9CLOT|nr:flavodoxin family protein [Clostridium sp. DSM 17811]